jgi:hypothetical protein
MVVYSLLWIKRSEVKGQRSAKAYRRARPEDEWPRTAHRTPGLDD